MNNAFAGRRNDLLGRIVNRPFHFRMQFARNPALPGSCSAKNSSMADDLVLSEM